MNRLNVEITLKETKELMRKCGFRKVFVLLDRLLLQTLSQGSDQHPLLILRVVRRIQRASLFIIRDSVNTDDHTKEVVMQLFERMNLQLLAYHVSLTRMIQSGTGYIDKEDDESSKRRKQVVSVKKIMDILQGQLKSIKHVLFGDQINKISPKSKLRFHLLTFWTSTIDHLVLWSDYYKKMKDGRYAALLLVKVFKFVKLIKKSKSPSIIGSVALYYLKTAQLLYEIYEFRQAIDMYEKAFKYLKKQMNMWLELSNCPNVIDSGDIQRVIPIIQKIVYTLYMLSTLYLQVSKTHKAYECLHLATWFLEKVLRDDESQLSHVVYKAYDDFQQNISHYLVEEAEIIHMLSNVIYIEPQVEFHEKNKKDPVQETHEIMFTKFEYSQLNKKQMVIDRVKSEPKCITEENLVELPSKKLKSNLTEASLVSEQTKSTLIKPELRRSETVQTPNTFSRTPQCSTPQKKETPEIPRKYTKSFAKFESQLEKMNHPNILEYCDLRPSRHGVPDLDYQMSLKIAKTMKNEPFLSMSQIKQGFQYQKAQDYIANQDNKFAHTGLQFKQKLDFSFNIQATNSRSLRNRFKVETSLLSHTIICQDQIKKAKLNRSAQQQVTPTPEMRHNLMRQILLKHGKEFGLKKIKKGIMQAQNESSHNKLKEANAKRRASVEQKSEEQIRQEINQTNLNVMKIFIDENQAKQQTYNQHLKHRTLTSQDQPSTPRQKLNSPCSLAESTQYFSVRNDVGRKINNFTDLVNIKKKVNLFERSHIGTSDVVKRFKSHISD